MVLVIIILVAIIAGSISFVALMTVINVLALLEFYRLVGLSGISPRRLSGILLSLSLVASFFLFISSEAGWEVLLCNVPVAAAIFISELFQKSDTPFQHLAFTFLGVIYITIPVCFFIAVGFLSLGDPAFQYQMILGYFLILWAGDSAAYFTGKSLGKHFLFKRISPHKTWEGSIGGFCCALIAGYVSSYLFPVIATMEWMALAFIIIVTGTFGDLVKSLMKRSFHVKDSGTILPGHGGILDRFDSLLGSAPFAFSFLILLQSQA